MKLDDFLKPKKVRCINRDNHGYLTENKVYDVIGAIFGRLKIRNDNGDNHWYDMTCFELVIDSAENPPQGMELTPEFEAVEPKFKVGDKVYVGLTGRIAQVTGIIDDDVVSVANKNNEVRAWVSNICHATPENHALLSKLYPHIEFEQPPKPLTGIELAKKLIAKGHNYLVVDTVIGIRVLTRLEGNTLIDSNNVRLDELDDITPLNDETGEPLTESILND